LRKGEKLMVQLNDKLVVGDKEFLVCETQDRPGELILRVVVTKGPCEGGNGYVPVEIWEAAVRGASFPTDQELIRLQEKFEEKYSDSISGIAARNYIKALEDRLRKLTEENQRWSTANSKAVEDLLRGTEDLENRLTKIRCLAQGVLEAIEKETVLDDGEEND